MLDVLGGFTGICRHSTGPLSHKKQNKTNKSSEELSKKCILTSMYPIEGSCVQTELKGLRSTGQICSNCVTANTAGALRLIMDFNSIVRSKVKKKKFKHTSGHVDLTPCQGSTPTKTEGQINNK